MKKNAKRLLANVTATRKTDGDILGQIDFFGHNTASMIPQLFGSIKVVADDVTDGTEDATMKFDLFGAGTGATILNLNSLELYPEADSTLTLGRVNARLGAVTTLVLRLPTVITSDTTTRILSNSDGIEYHVLDLDVHEFFVDSVRMFSIIEVSGGTFLLMANNEHTIFSTSTGFVHDVDEGESHQFKIDGILGLTIIDAVAGATTKPVVILPIYTDSTRPTPSEAGEGAMIYNSDDNGANYSDGTNWYEPSSGWVTT